MSVRLHSSSEYLGRVSDTYNKQQYHTQKSTAACLCSS